MLAYKAMQEEGEEETAMAVTLALLGEIVG